MCIIVNKPENAKFPSWARMEECFRRNPDGAGFMYAAGGAVQILKGFQTFAAFRRALEAAREIAGDAAPFVLHFRISTQAGTRPDCCHPFPLSSNMDDLRLLSCACKIGIAHNGIITACSEYAPGLTYSDTMRFIVDYASLIIRGPGYYKRPATLELLRRLTGSRLAILDARGHCEMIGDGWTEDGGCYYSNKSYKPRPAYNYLDAWPEISPEPSDAWTGGPDIYDTAAWTDDDAAFDEITLNRRGHEFTIYRDGPYIGIDCDGELLEELRPGPDADGLTLYEIAADYFADWL